MENIEANGIENGNDFASQEEKCNMNEDSIIQSNNLSNIASQDEIAPEKGDTSKGDDTNEEEMEETTNTENKNYSSEKTDKANEEISSHTDPDQNFDAKEELTDQEDKWIQVLGHDKLKLKVVCPGAGVETRPLHGQVVTIRCCGLLEDGTKIDQHERMQLTVGDGDVVQAIDLCIALLQLTEKALIVTDSRYAYGKQGRKPDVPSNAQITYEIELLRIEDGPDVSKLSIQEKIRLGNVKRECGNMWYNRSDYVAAINSYTKSLKLLDESNTVSESKESVEDFTEMRVKCFNNLAAAQLKAEAWDAGIKSCDLVIRLQPDNCKAHFRKGKCLAGKGELEQAIESLREAINIEPDSKLIHHELSKMVKKHNIQSQSTKDMYRRMLGTEKEKINASKGSYRWLSFIGGAGACLALAFAFAYHHRYL